MRRDDVAVSSWKHILLNLLTWHLICEVFYSAGGADIVVAFVKKLLGEYGDVAFHENFISGI